MKIIKMTADEYEELTNSPDSPGKCLYCGAEASSCEPDARKYHCEECDTCNVYGLEECLLMGMIEFT